MSELRALLFDVDGALADTERDGHRVAFNRAFREAGLDWDWTTELYGELLAVTGGKGPQSCSTAQTTAKLASRSSAATFHRPAATSTVS